MTFLRALRVAGLLAPLMCFGCEGSSSNDYRVEVVYPSGENPFIRYALDQVTVQIQAEDGDISEQTTSARGDGFMLRFPLESTDFEMQVRVEVTGETRLFGGPPLFRLDDVLGFLRIPVGEPGTCEVLEWLSLAVPRVDMAFAAPGGFAMAFGGNASTATEDVIDALDLLWLRDSTEPLSFLPLGKWNAAAFDATRALAHSSSGAFYAVDLRVNSERVREIHFGLSDYEEVAVLSKPGGGVVVVAGDQLAVADAQHEVEAWETTVRVQELKSYRSSPTAVVLEEAVWISGAGEGARLLERASFDGSSEPRTEQMAPARQGTHLFGDGDVFWILGGEGEDGLPHRDILRLQGCADFCEPSPSLEWPQARSRMAVLQTSGGGYLIGGQDADGEPSDLVEYVDLHSEQIRAMGPLRHPRTGAGAARLASGVMLVVGGLGVDGAARADVEICFPESLEPLVP
ncbi:MAG: hypothetical protein AAF355_14920 [Myxococcota bacterium]